MSLVKSGERSRGLGKAVKLYNLPVGQDTVIEADVKSECNKASLGEVTFSNHAITLATLRSSCCSARKCE